MPLTHLGRSRHLYLAPTPPFGFTTQCLALLLNLEVDLFFVQFAAFPLAFPLEFPLAFPLAFPSP